MRGGRRVEWREKIRIKGEEGRGNLKSEI